MPKTALALVIATLLGACAGPSSQVMARARSVAAIFPDAAEQTGIHLAERAGRRAVRVVWDTAKVTGPAVEWRVSGYCLRIDDAHDGRTRRLRRAGPTATRLSDGRIATLREATFACLRG